MNEGGFAPELVPERRLRRLELMITRRLDGLLHGSYLGLLPGIGSEPAGSKEYRPGEDEVRRMDWAVTARTTVPHVRTVDADRELATHVLVDASASMDFGTADLEKRELALAAVAAVGFLTLGNGNRLGAHLLSGDAVRRYPARGGRPSLLALLRAMMLTPRNQHPVSLGAGIEALHRQTPRTGLVVVVSDFLDGLDEDGLGPGAPEWEEPLRRLAARHQVLAVQVGDPREQELPDVGLLTLVDPETGRRREVPTASKKLRAKYAAAAAQQQATIAAAVKRAGAAHLPLRTDRDWVADIVRHVHARRRLSRAAAKPQRTPS
ncbi:hypothetical protein Aab01nite_09580 [Paractinoplanes abujensis]|uniref:Uncharacterized protein (DUF58 family) n=1 Tax=Paractinoplanes abujensis TaxID=882441 RepID=A0A7W7CMD2_9ACTN|nr:DUF58 domain-containing protein [Actinoplanes abujensis]MBB4691215.1 uncharacterized protein (DUF58 family) [Actinoplanes abujensis]GID17368.1 hypothetical protein Aab01nite_09580 [Actinoplanes abujensis]